SAVYLRAGDGNFIRAATGGVAPVQEPVLPPDPAASALLEKGRVSLRATDQPYVLLVPITLPASSGTNQASRLAGILAVGSRLSGQGFSREEIAMLLTLADQAGTSLHV